MDFNFFGDQLVIHLVPKNALQEAAHNNALEGMTYLCRILVWCWV
jgi:extradiol dioxygenase family protein